MKTLRQKIRPPQMWWIIEQQARRRRAAVEEPGGTASWTPGSVVAEWVANGVEGSGDSATFATVDPASVTSLDFSYDWSISEITGLENLTSLVELFLNYCPITEITALPSSLETLNVLYTMCSALPNLTTTPNLTYLHLYATLINSASIDNLLMQLDANGKLNGEVYLWVTEGRTPASDAAVASLIGKGWLIDE